MMKALLSVRFRALFGSFLNQSRKKKQKSTGLVILYTVLYLYLAVVLCGAMAITFLTLAEPYHQLGLDWLYFAMAGMMSLAMAIIGSVFTTQSQLYDAKDNGMLLAMPIPPRNILLSRMIPLLSLNLLYAGLVFIPAVVVYAIVIGFSGSIVLQVLTLLAITVLAQAIACLFGWLLHLLLSRMNKSFASVLYMVLFLGIYFSIYSRIGNILNAMIVSGEEIASTLKAWVWPLYALGQGCIGNIWLFLAFCAICILLFAIVYRILSATFLASATMQYSSRKRKKLSMTGIRTASATDAIIRKELGKFLNCPVYLTNMGLGIILTAALIVASLIFRNQLLMFLEIPELQELFAPMIPVIICAMLSFMISTMAISTPSVSLEGKNIWILKSMPLTPKQILLAKLRFHCVMTAPVTALAGLILALAYGCSIADSILCALIPAALCLLCGLLGLVTGLHWVRLDYISEAYPCKQSLSVLVTMMSIMGLPMVLGAIYWFLLSEFMTITVFLLTCVLLIALLCLIFYRILMGWGCRKWLSIN